MSIVKRFITESIKKTEIDEFLQKRLERAGYGGVDLSKTPLGTHVVIYAMRPGIVIGRGGETIKDLATTSKSQTRRFPFQKSKSLNSMLTWLRPAWLPPSKEAFTLDALVFGL